MKWLSRFPRQNGFGATMATKRGCAVGLTPSWKNRTGLCALFQMRNASGEPESQVAVDGVIELLNRCFKSRGVRGYRGYRTEEFIEGLREEQRGTPSFTHEVT